MSNGCGKQEAICHVLLHALCRDLLSLSLSFHTCRIAPRNLGPVCHCEFQMGQYWELWGTDLVPGGSSHADSAAFPPTQLRLTMGPAPPCLQCPFS